MNEDLQAQISSLQATINELLEFKANIEGNLMYFSGKTVNNKTLEMSTTGRLKFTNLTADPAYGTKGEVVLVAGKLKLQTGNDPANPDWVVIGVQT